MSKSTPWTSAWKRGLIVGALMQGLNAIIGRCRDREELKMAGRLKSWLASPSLLRTLVSHWRLAVRLVREPRVPTITKAVPFLAVLYVLSPFDFVPDVIPVLGQLDDLGIVVIALQVFAALSPLEPVTFHRAAIVQGRRYSPMPATDNFIDAEWRRQ